MKDSIVIITGAAQGIGKAAAERFLQEGSTVILIDLNEEKLNAVKKEQNVDPSRIDIFKCDIGNSCEVNNVVERISEKYGKVDVLVNCAGIVQSTQIENTTDEEWTNTLRVNLNGVFFLCRAIIPVMKKQKNGKIVNISSLAGKNGGIKSGGAYSASKAGVISLTQTLSRELAPYNIHVNAIAPSMVATEMAATFTQEQRDELLAGVPLRRFAEPEEIASLIFFLSTKESNFITGEVVDINGGSFLDA